MVVMESYTTPLRPGLAWLSVFVLLLFTCVISPVALAVTPIKLSDLSYFECPAEIGEGSVTSGGGILKPAKCYIITGRTENKSGKVVVNADVFGRIYDANNNPVIQNRARLGAIDEVPPGIGTFELRISVPEGLETPLKFKQFKASGFIGKVYAGGSLE